MLIGELSRRTGVGAHLLRYYEAQDLLEATRGANGYRQYAEDAVLTVRQIKMLLKAGLSTKDIAYVLPCASGATPALEPCDELLLGIRARLRKLDEHIDALTESRRALSRYLDTTERTRETRGAALPGER